MVFQDYALWPHMNVLANIEYPLKIAGNSPDERKKKVKRILEVVKMEDMEARFPHELSGGQQQRIALARALVSDPKVLLLDEPLSNLDASLRDSMRVEIKSIHKRLGVTIFFVTHDQAEAISMSDRIVVMNSGVIQQLGTPEELYDFPANEFVASFLGKANFFKVIKSRGELCLLAGEESISFKPEKIIGNLEKGLGCVKPSDIDILKNTKKGIKGKIESSYFTSVDYAGEAEIFGKGIEGVPELLHFSKKNKGFNRCEGLGLISGVGRINVCSKGRELEGHPVIRG